MPTAAELLRAYDEQLREDAEVAGALAVERIGPVLLAREEGGRYRVTYRDLAGADAAGVAALVDRVCRRVDADPDATEVEWKTRGHDVAPGLPDALTVHGFTAEPTESVMVGEAAALAVDVPLPDGVSLRRVTEPEDVLATCRMQAAVFGNRGAEQIAAGILRRIAAAPGVELWAAEAAGEVVSAGRWDPVPGTVFAGIWGGATLPGWRGRGIYRALTAARARSALAQGFSLVTSDSTPFSRPILERSGLLAVSTTTPWLRGRRG